MKKIILVILSVLCLVSCKQSEKKNDLTEENLKGKVKSIKETPYEAVDKFGQIEKGNVLYDNFIFPFTIYDEKGNKIEENHYDSDGNLSSKDTYEYDEKGNNIERNWYDSDGSLNYKYTYKYDEKGNMIEYNTDGRFGEKYTYKYEYDKNNNWIQQVTYEDNKPIQITERIIEYYP